MISGPPFSLNTARLYDFGREEDEVEVVVVVSAGLESLLWCEVIFWTVCLIASIFVSWLESMNYVYGLEIEGL